MIKKLRIIGRGGLLLAFMAAMVVSALAQERVVTGTVRDAETGETLIGVNITAATGPTLGTVTDIDGKYMIALPDTVMALQFSYVGYASQIIPITSNVIHVDLSPGKELSEVVVIGYGTQKTREVTSAVSRVTEEDFNNGNISDPIQLIQGKVSGLSIARPGSDPNADFNIRLRGLSTFGSNTEPLVIIDGIQGASLKSVDPEDIVSVDVLKDASAAAIYGTRAASGVIIITTKKGQYAPEGKAFNVEFATNLTTEMVSKSVNVLTADEFKEFQNTTDFGSNTDWFDELTRNAFSHAYNLAVSGADQNTSYRVSANYRNVDGVVIGTGFDQLNGRINLSQKALKDKLNIDFNLSSTIRREQYVPSEAFQYAVRFNPTAPVHDDTSAFGQEWGGYYQAQAFYHYNPVAITEQSILDGKKYNLQGGIKGTYEIIKGLKVAAFYSLTMTNELYGTYWSKYSFWTPYDVGSHKGYARKETKDYSNQLLELTANYEKTIGKVSFSVLGGYSYFDQVSDNFWAFGEDFLTDDFTYNSLGSASGEIANSESMSSYKEGSTLIGFFGRATFNYDNGVFLTANFRRDGSSMFGENNKWGNFPGVSAGVDIARFAGIPYVDRLKVRAGYGVTGNLPPDPYLSQLLYDVVEGGYFFYNGDFIQAFGPVRNANPDLKWETKKELGFGLDYALFDYRLSGSIDYYKSTSSDLILFYRVPVPPYPAEYMWLNVGELQNAGVEFAINYQSPQSNVFNWSVDFNFTRYMPTKLSKITSDISEGTSTRYLGELGDPFLVGINTILVQEGEQIGQIIAPIYQGIDSTGKLIVEDYNEDGKIDVNDYQVVGSGLPDFQLGLGGSVSYKGFFASLFFRAVLGHSIVNVNNAKFGVPNVLGIQSGVEMALDYKDAINGPVYSDVHVEKADFLRLDNWSLGYKFKIKDNDYIEGVKVFFAGQNLFTLTNYSGVDPEVRYVDTRDSDNPLAPGIDRQNTYLMTRSFTLGVNVVF